MAPRQERAPGRAGNAGNWGDEARTAPAESGLRGSLLLRRCRFGGRAGLRVFHRSGRPPRSLGGRAGAPTRGGGHQGEGEGEEGHGLLVPAPHMLLHRSLGLRLGFPRRSRPCCRPRPTSLLKSGSDERSGEDLGRRGSGAATHRATRATFQCGLCFRRIERLGPNRKRPRTRQSTSPRSAVVPESLCRRATLASRFTRRTQTGRALRCLHDSPSSRARHAGAAGPARPDGGGALRGGLAEGAAAREPEGNGATRRGSCLASSRTLA